MEIIKNVLPKGSIHLQKGLRDRNSPTCTLSQNGYGACQHPRTKLGIAAGTDCLPKSPMCCNLCNRCGGHSLLLPNHSLLAESPPFLKNVHAVPGTPNKIIAQRKQNMKKVGVLPLICYRGFCIPVWTVFQPLQVVLSSACSVASLSRFPNHYLPGHPHLREGALAAYLFGQGSPPTWCAELTAVHSTPSAQLPCGAQRGVTFPRYNRKTR